MFTHDPRLPDQSYLFLHLDYWNPSDFVRSFIEKGEWQQGIAFQVQEVFKQYAEERKAEKSGEE